jgi:hypothetical protein
MSRWLVAWEDEDGLLREVEREAASAEAAAWAAGTGLGSDAFRFLGARPAGWLPPVLSPADCALAAKGLHAWAAMLRYRAAPGGAGGIRGAVADQHHADAAAAADLAARLIRLGLGTGGGSE